MVKQGLFAIKNLITSKFIEKANNVKYLCCNAPKIHMIFKINLSSSVAKKNCFRNSRIVVFEFYAELKFLT